MKVKVFDESRLDKEQEIFLKLKEFGAGSVELLMVKRDGSYVQSPCLLMFQIDPKTEKLTFYRMSSVNWRLVETNGSGVIKETNES